MVGILVFNISHSGLFFTSTVIVPGTMPVSSTTAQSVYSFNGSVVAIASFIKCYKTTSPTWSLSGIKNIACLAVKLVSLGLPSALPGGLSDEKYSQSASLPEKYKLNVNSTEL